jgi:hypothetical protein
VLGRTVDEVRHAYKDDLQQGRDLVLTLLPTEWDRFGTRVTLAVTGTGASAKVRELSFAVPWKGHPEARDSLFELFKKKWGEPKEVNDDGKTYVVFRDDSPRVEVREDDAHGAWQIVMR